MSFRSYVSLFLFLFLEVCFIFQVKFCNYLQIFDHAHNSIVTKYDEMLMQIQISVNNIRIFAHVRFPIYHYLFKPRIKIR